MVAVPIKPQYGPTLGQLLAPRWRRARTLVRAAIVAGCVALVALLAGVALSLLSPTYSHGGPVPFHLSYRDLYRTALAAGQYVRVQRLDAAGRLRDSLAVSPLMLPHYSGELSAELPLYAAGFIPVLRGRYEDFQLRGEGKGTVNSVPAYSIYYSVRLRGREMYGRDVLLLPERRGARAGLDITMLTVPTPNVHSPLEVASGGVLSSALKSVTLG
jgi:hypothetical protein